MLSATIGDKGSEVKVGFVIEQFVIELVKSDGATKFACSG